MVAHPRILHDLGFVVCLTSDAIGYRCCEPVLDTNGTSASFHMRAAYRRSE